ncbi:hypothetical protein OU798_07350 [Prolixibacteraceae bacterium Z1-6]|uniref:Uncharacterized protein n=1 Tax=Draconibacterium aestuarii TaxID=2998507 RepID=A0A9X3F5E1_9BACT|nr:hypothetical protein [Prolixibacteraceae bacterium Z1-6]
MKRLVLILIALPFLLIACNDEKQESIEPLPKETGTFSLSAQDDTFYSFALKKDQEYTLSLDFSNYNFNQYAEETGWGHLVAIEWGSPDYSFAIEASLGTKTNAEFKCPKSSMCLVPKQDIVVKIKVYDIDYSNNSGTAIISMQKGKIGFFDGENSSVLPGKYGEPFNLPLQAETETKISLDFSQHTFNAGASEPDGWKHAYSVSFNNWTTTTSLEIGTSDNPIVGIPNTSITVFSKNNNILKYRVLETDADNTHGNVFINY